MNFKNRLKFDELIVTLAWCVFETHCTYTERKEKSNQYAMLITFNPF